MDRNVIPNSGEEYMMSRGHIFDDKINDFRHMDITERYKYMHWLFTVSITV